MISLSMKTLASSPGNLQHLYATSEVNKCTEVLKNPEDFQRIFVCIFCV